MPKQGEEEKKWDRRAKAVLVRVVPFGVQAVASFATYTGGLAAVQLVGWGLRVSCATPVIGPALGFVGVGAASVLAGHVARATRKAIDRKTPLLESFPLFAEFSIDDAILDAFLGVTVFKVMGGRFGSAMPSDLIKPGAFAKHSLPAKGYSYIGESSTARLHLRDLFTSDGCHHCGTKSIKGGVVGDHMPPSKLVKFKEQSWRGVPELLKAVLTVLRQKPDLRQRFYPQCASCSSKQGAALRAGKTTALVMHQVPVGPPQLLAAVLVGCHPYCTFLSSGPGGGFSIASRRSTGVSSIGLTLPLPPFISRRRTTASARPTTSTDLSAQAHPLVVLNTVNADNADGDSPNQEVVASGAGFAGFRRGGYKVVASASSDDLLATAASAATSDSVADVPEEYYLPPPVDAAFVGALAGGAEAVVATPVGKVASVVEAYTTAALEAGQQAAAAAAVGGKGPSPTAKGPSPTGKGPSPPKAPLGFATL